MIQRQDEDLPYRSPALFAPRIVDSRPTDTQDIANYDTLRAVREAFSDKLEALYKDFNSFELVRGIGKDRSAEDIYIQISARQIAYDILAPLLEATDNAIQLVDDKFKKGR